MLFFDIGANVGAWAKANASMCDTIVSVEASPTTHGRLVSAKLAKVVALNYAVCNNNGEDIVFNECTNDTLSTLNRSWLDAPSSRFFNQPFKQIVCKTITIDELIKRYGIPDLCKVDVEGGEYMCISSLTSKIPLLCFEWASEVNDITFKCIDYLESLGFTQFTVQFGDNYTFRPTTFNTSQHVKNVLSGTTPKEHWGMIWCI
jgi:FkbM family methyltransferase